MMLLSCSKPKVLISHSLISVFCIFLSISLIVSVLTDFQVRAKAGSTSNIISLRVNLGGIEVCPNSLLRAPL